MLGTLSHGQAPLAKWERSVTSRSTRSSATAVGVLKCLRATKSATHKSVSWPMPVNTGSVELEMARHKSRSLKASRSKAEPPPRTMTTTSGCHACARESASIGLVGRLCLARWLQTPPRQSPRPIRCATGASQNPGSQTSPESQSGPRVGSSAAGGGCGSVQRRPGLSGSRWSLAFAALLRQSWPTRRSLQSRGSPHRQGGIHLAAKHDFRAVQGFGPQPSQGFAHHGELALPQGAAHHRQALSAVLFNEFQVDVARRACGQLGDFRS